jgi:hypothetical protein
MEKHFFFLHFQEYKLILRSAQKENVRGSTIRRSLRPGILAEELEAWGLECLRYSQDRLEP